MIQTTNLNFEYTSGLPALSCVDFHIAANETVAIMGASGSGKTSLMHCLSGLLLPTASEFTTLIDGERVDFLELTHEERADWRLKSVGFVFQNAELVPEFTVRQNIALPLELVGVSRKETNRRVNDLISALGLQDCCDRKPHLVSGGQRQRAAVARAVVHQPLIVFADEPTGALDSLNSKTVLDVLIEATQSVGAALVIVTHDPEVAAHTGRTVVIHDGRIVEPA